MNKSTFDAELKKAQKRDMEAKKTQLINKIHYEDRKVISNFHMIKLSDILMIKETIRSLEMVSQGSIKNYINYIDRKIEWKI